MYIRAIREVWAFAPFASFAPSDASGVLLLIN